MKIDEKIFKTNIKTFREVNPGEVFIIIATGELCLKLKKVKLHDFYLNSVYLSTGVLLNISSDEQVFVKDVKLVDANGV